MREHAAQNLALAARILAWECQQRTSAGDDIAPAIEEAFRRLFDALSPIVGSGGYRAFFERAVDLSKRDHPWLGVLVVSTPFAIPQLTEQVTRTGAEPAIRGAGVLFGTLLDLLCAFIGESLTLRNVYRVWTEISADERLSSIPPKETT